MTTVEQSGLLLDVVFYEKTNTHTRGRQLGWKKTSTNYFYIARIMGVIEGVLPNDSLKIPCEIISHKKEEQISDIVYFLKNKGLSGRIRRRYLPDGEVLQPIVISDGEMLDFNNRLWGKA